MKGFKDILSSRTFSVVSLLLAAALLFFAGIGGARAALTIYSNNYKAQLDIHDIGVSLLENGDIVSYRNYKGKGKVDADNLDEDEEKNWDHSEGLDSIEDDKYDPLLKRFDPENKDEDYYEEFVLGKESKEEITVKNTGTVNQFVRVTVYKYWLDNDGKRDRSLDPELIDLQYNTDNVGEGKDWVEDKDSETTERRVFYYTNILAVGDETSALTKAFSITPDVARVVTQEETQVDNSHKKIKTVYDYDGRQFCIQARVDAVQDHHAADAILSAWGREVTVSDGTLSLK